MRTISNVLVVLFLTFLLLPGEAIARKLEKDELIELHLKAIGEDPARKSRVAQGRGNLDIRVGGLVQLGGPAKLISEGRKLRSSIRFGHPQFPEELVIYDGKKVEVADVSPGVRSQLGESLWVDFHDLIQEGLYGGALNTGWPLLDLEARQPSLKYKGLKKFHGRKLHQVEYKPKNNVDYRIALYFEPETYRHVASAYRLTAVSGKLTMQSTQGLGEGSASSPVPNPQAHQHLEVHDGSTSRYKITVEERFEDFKEVDGLILPHTYRVTIDLDRDRAGDFLGHWEMQFDRITHDSAIDPMTFAVK